MPVSNRYPRPNLFNPQERPHIYTQGRPSSTHQQQFLNDVKEEASITSADYSGALYEHGASLGYSQQQVDHGLSRMSTTHSTVNFNPAKRLSDGTSVMESMANDDFHRNMFETQNSGAGLSTGQRDYVEQSLYNSHYRGVPAYAHPGYGALNMANNPHGAAPQAGDSYLKIKPEVHQNATFTHFDSARANRYQDLGTSEYNKHVLAKTTHHTFDNVMQGSSSRPADPQGDYIEVQYHQKLRYGEDVDSLNVHSSHQDTDVGQSARRFRDNHGTKLYWVDTSGQRRPSYGGDGGYDHHSSYHR